MLVVLKADYEEVSREAAKIVAATIRNKPSAVLGLATGNTPLGLYKELIRMHREEHLDFSRTVSFNLDEYLGLAPSHPQSFHSFMNVNFFSHVNIPAQNIRIPDGTVSQNYDAYCASYEEDLRRAGGIDLQILGIGRNGHVGFNEPTSSLASRTRLKALSRETIKDNLKFFGDEKDVPKCAITMGIGTILEARRILLLASGKSKAAAVAGSIEGPVTASVPASALQLHPEATFLVDEEASSALAKKDYYRHVLDMTALFTPERLS
ncbi:MAG TPA: glucosamine-6-phosphate deaminase [Candidatus Acidoferrum sp.]|nr:glucosamine-6-phosphate deaminase [Candidatus Acidoferrum sp.]